MEWFKTISGSWTSSSSGRLFSSQRKRKHATQGIEITLPYLCQQRILETQEVDLYIRTPSSSLFGQSTFPISFFGKTKLEKVYCLHVSFFIVYHRQCDKRRAVDTKCN